MIKRIIIAVVIVLGLLFIGNFFIINYAVNSYSDETEALKELVGEEIIIKGDTLMVLDYSVLNSTVTLDDGREVSAELVKKLVKEDNE